MMIAQTNKTGQSHGREKDEIEILFQPQFAAQGSALTGAEALTRWRDPENGPTIPDPLFLFGEHARSPFPFERIAREALARAASWPHPLRLSLNAAAEDLAGAGFVETVAGALADSGFPGERLTLEITEQALLADIDHSAGRLERLASMGIRIALDDFGAGYCNFQYLKRLPLHYLKLDRSMVHGIGEDRRDLEVFRGIMAMASALGLEVVAEGIETEEQRAIAAREGCALWQGFLGARPMGADEFAALAAA